MKKNLVFLGVVLLVLSAVGNARLETGPASLPCGSGLAAQDLAGVCRAKPKPTPGALEAVGEIKSSETKTQTKPGSKKKLPPETSGSF
jgi:hypothetical protein